MSDTPTTLPVGTEVSAKFKGAFCEARVVAIHKELKVKVTFSQNEFGYYTHTQLENAKIELNEYVNVQRPNSRKSTRGQITLIKDMSRYDVVFNDGDEAKLRRSQMVLKSRKHFAGDVTLDKMPLTNPESHANKISPLSMRGAAKRGAQKIRNSLNNSNVSNSRNGNQTDGMEEDEDDERGRPVRRAANFATVATGDRGHKGGTQSDESAADSSEEKEKAKDRRKKKDDNKEKAGGSSYAVDSDVDDEAGPSSNLLKRDASMFRNGAPSDRNQTQNSKEKKQQREKDRKKLLREKEKEQERQKKRREKMIKKEAEKKRRAENRDLLNKKKQAEKLSPLSVRLMKMRKKLFKKILYRHSPRLDMRLNELKRKLKNDEINSRRKKKKKRKFVYLPDKIHVRSHLLYKRWKIFCEEAKLSMTARYVKQWRRMSNKFIRKVFRVKELMKTPRRRRRVEQWLGGFERVRHGIQVVAVFMNYNHSRSFLQQTDGAEKKTFAERYAISRADIHSPYLHSFFLENQWFPAVVFPHVFYSSHGGQHRLRTVRLMGTANNNNLVQIWEEDLVPFKWVPRYKEDEFDQVLFGIPRELRKKFILANTFAFDLSRKGLMMSSVRSRLGWKEKPSTEYMIVDKKSGQRTIAPSPTDPVKKSDAVEEVRDVEDDSEYDSDASIKNAPAEDRDLLVAHLFQYHETKNSGITTTPKIQGFDVDLYYFSQLARKMGGVKKVIASNPWAVFCRKLVPRAVDAEDELKEIFKMYLEGYLSMSQKFGQAEKLGPRTERKHFIPGQYSETRRRKQRPDEPSTSSSNLSATPSRRGGRGGGRGRGRKRKPSSPGESPMGRNKKGRRAGSAPSSRAATEERDSSTVSQSRSGLLNSSSDDHEDATSSMMSTDGSERRGSVVNKHRDRKNKTSVMVKDAKKNRKDDQTPASVPPKKGRPRKNALPVTPAPRPVKKSKKAEVGLWNGFVNANVLSRIRSGQKIAAFFDKRWYPATASEDVDDFTDELMEVMLSESGNHTPGQLSDETKELLEDVYQKMIAKTHYTGWNVRYDEYVKLPKLMVTVEDQEAARRRFRHLPRGDELLPEVLALVEGVFMNKEYIERTDQGERTTTVISSSQFLKMAQDALLSPPPMISPPKGRRRKRSSDPRVVFSDASDEEEEESEEDEKEEHKEESDEEEEEEEEGKEEEKNGKEKNEAKENDEESQPSTSAVQRHSESEKSSSESEEEELEEDNEEEEDKEESNHVEEPDEHASEPPPRQLLPVLTAPVQPVHSGRRSPSAGLEEESDEPEYPPGPSTPELAEMALAAANSRPPVLQNNQSVPSLGSNSSGCSNLPVLTPQISSQSIPSTTSPPSSVPVRTASPPKPFSPPVPIVHSGPLILEEFKPSSSCSIPTVSPSSAFTSKPPAQQDGGKASDEERKRLGGEVLAEPAAKRLRTFSSTEETKSPSRTPLPAGVQNQFSSGALILEIPPPTESSGPIELPIKGLGKKSTPVFQKPSPSAVTSGPLIISPPASRQPQKSPLGRPRDGAAGSSSSLRTSTETDDLDVCDTEKRLKDQHPFDQHKKTFGEKESQDSRAPSGSTTPMTTEEKDEETDKEQFDKPPTPRGSAGRGGKRRRGGRFGGSYSTKPARGVTKKKEDNGDEKEMDDYQVPTHSGRSDFLTQKCRLARQLEERGLHRNYHEILTDQDTFDVVRARINQKDIGLALEERTNALREEFHSCKAEFAQLEKRWRVLNETKRRAEAAEQADSGETGSRSPSVGPSSSSGIGN